MTAMPVQWPSTAMDSHNQQDQSPMKKKSFSQLFAETSSSPIEIKTPTTYKGKPAIYFSREDIAKVASPIKFAAIRKFLHGRPKIEEIRKFFSSLDLKGEVNVGHLYHRHVLIRCAFGGGLLKNLDEEYLVS